MKLPYYKFSSSIISTMFLFCVLFYSCKTNPSAVVTSGLGAPGELLVAIDPAFIHQGVKARIEDFAQIDFPALPQSEPTFKILSISLDELKNHFKAYRNILIVRKSEDGNSGIDYKYNVWAKNQQVAEFSVVDEDSFYRLFSQSKGELYDFLYYGDIKTMAKELKKSENAQMRKFLCDKYNLDMIIPDGYRLVRDTFDFSWFRFDNKETIQNVLIKTFPLDSVVGTEKESLMSLCNAATQKYVPGPVFSSFMTIEEKCPVEFKELDSNGETVMELRGVWKVQGYFMGGPFVNYFVKDSKNNRLVMIETFVYAPRKQNKAYYMRMMESILYTLRIS